MVTFSSRIRLEEQPTQLSVRVTAEVQAADCFLAGVAALRVRDTADLIEAQLLRDRLLVDFRGESRPPREDPRQLQCRRLAWMRTTAHQPLYHGIAIVRSDRDLKQEGRRLGRAGDFKRYLADGRFEDAIRTMRHRQAGGSHHCRGVCAGDSQDRHVFGAIRRARESRRHRPLQDRQRAVAPFRRHGEAEAL